MQGNLGITLENKMTQNESYRRSTSLTLKPFWLDAAHAGSATSSHYQAINYLNGSPLEGTQSAGREKRFEEYLKYLPLLCLIQTASTEQLAENQRGWHATSRQV